METCYFKTIKIGLACPTGGSKNRAVNKVTAIALVSIALIASLMLGCEQKQKHPKVRSILQSAKQAPSPTAQARDQLAVFGIEGLRPMTVGLRDDLLAALAMTDRVDATCMGGCSTRAYVAAFLPAEEVAEKLQHQLPSVDPIRSLFVETFQSYGDLGLELKKAGNQDKLQLQEFSGNILATHAMAKMRKYFLTQVLDEHPATNVKMIYYMTHDEPVKEKAMREQMKAEEMQKQQAKKEVEAARLAVIADRRQAESDKKKSEIDKRVLQFQEQQAAAGSGTAQYDLGLRYLNGNGVEVNRDTAIRWLRAACTNGNSSASNQLSKLYNAL